MLDTEKLQIEVSQGDTGVVTIHFTGDDAPADDVTALVTLKESVHCEKSIWEKEIQIENRQCVIILDAEDTNIMSGTYWWDVRLLYENGSIYTPMKPAKFIILNTVGDAHE